VRRLLVTASVVPSSPLLVTLMKEALSSSETSALTRATRLNIPKDAILQDFIPLLTSSRWVLESTHPPIQWIPGIKRPVRETDDVRLMSRPRIRFTMHALAS
jgi:hypothetical protein